MTNYKDIERPIMTEKEMNLLNIVSTEMKDHQMTIENLENVCVELKRFYRREAVIYTKKG